MNRKVLAVSLVACSLAFAGEHWTAILMAGFAIWSIAKINATIDYPSIQWLWGALWFLFGFAMLEAGVQRVFGNRLTDMPKLAKAMLKKRFGKK